MKKLIVSDLDGTLLQRGEKKLPKDICKAIEKAVQSGVAVCIASGRCYSELKDILQDITDKIYVIALDGAAAIYKGKILFSTYINEEIAKEIIKKAKETNNLEVYIYNKTKKITDLSSVLKIALTGEDVFRKGKCITSCFEKEYVSLCACSSKWYEITAKGVNKGSALLKLCEHLRINTEDVFAIGDNFNDIKMLKEAGKSYAVEYSPPLVISNADEVIKRKDIVKLFID